MNQEHAFLFSSLQRSIQLQVRIARHCAWSIVIIGCALFGYLTACGNNTIAAVGSALMAIWCYRMTLACYHDQCDLEQELQQELALRLTRSACERYRHTEQLQKNCATDEEMI